MNFRGKMIELKKTKKKFSWEDLIDVSMEFTTFDYKKYEDDQNKVVLYSSFKMEYTDEYDVFSIEENKFHRTLRKSISKVIYELYNVDEYPEDGYSWSEHPRDLLESILANKYNSTDPSSYREEKIYEMIKEVKEETLKRILLKMGPIPPYKKEWFSVFEKESYYKKLK